MRQSLVVMLALSLLAGVLARLGLRRFLVHDTSMQPALQPTDRLLVAAWPRPRRGDIVVVRDPEQRTLWLVKRVASVQPDGSLVLHADNPNVSRDSRHFGAVPPRLLAGRVWYRYLPAERRGWVASRR